MMARLFVLDVEEFRPLVTAAEALGYRIHRSEDYVAIESAREPLVIPHHATAMRDALWFGALTGGYEGTLEQFDLDALRIT
jgi:hypothetical protein